MGGPPPGPGGDAPPPPPPNPDAGPQPAPLPGIDPNLAPLFVKLDLSIYDEMVSRHKALDDPDAHAREDEDSDAPDKNGSGPSMEAAA